MIKHPKRLPILLFLAMEVVLYYFILTAGGQTLVVTSYLAIVLCFLFSLQGVKTNPLTVAGLACTVGADFCLVICDPIQQLWGMVFFLGAQTFYAVHLHRIRKSTPLLIARLILTVAGILIAIFVLQNKTDALALISICYYANLIMNLVVAFTQWQKSKLLPIGFVLFILCDTIIGLQVAASGYLPIAEGSILYNLLFSGFNTAWMFYLPSQVLITLNCLPKGANNAATNESN